MKISNLNRIRFEHILACILVKGENLEGTPAYAYVALHLDEMVNVLEDLKQGKVFNPINYNATVLARFADEPSPEVKAFMRRKFGFSDTDVIIQRERPHITETL